MGIRAALPLTVAAGLMLAACVVGGTATAPAPTERAKLTITVADRVITPTGRGKADPLSPNTAAAGHTLRATTSSGNAADRPGRCDLDHVISGTLPPSHPLYVQKG
jgi:hypothetical protein